MLKNDLPAGSEMIAHRRLDRIELWVYRTPSDEIVGLVHAKKGIPDEMLADKELNARLNEMAQKAIKRNISHMRLRTVS